MAWIESHQELERHPKVLRLMQRMNWDLDTTLGKLHRFWWWCVDYAEDGDLRRFDDALIGFAVGVAAGDCKAFVEAMVHCGGDTKPGFIERDPYFRVHDWWRYIGLFLQRKYGDKNKAKWEKIKEMYCTAIVQPAVQELTQPNLTKPNKKKKNVKTVLDLVDPSNLLPAKPDPENLKATREVVKKVAEFAFLEDGTYPYLKIPAFATDWTAWLDMRKAMRVENGPRAMALALNKLHGWSVEKAVLSLQLSVERGYRGVFEPKEDGNGKNGSGWGGRKESRADRLDRDASELLRELGGAQGGNPPADQPDFSLCEPGEARG